MLDEREIGNQASVIELKTIKQPNYDIIKPLYFEDVNIGSDVHSEKDRSDKMTHYDREKLQMKIEEMKREINEHHHEDQQPTVLDENGNSVGSPGKHLEDEGGVLHDGVDHSGNEDDYPPISKTERVEWPQVNLYHTTKLDKKYLKNQPKTRSESRSERFKNDIMLGNRITNYYP